MKYSRFLVLAVLTGACFVFGLDRRTELWAQTVDTDTQRNDMHSCPVGSFVTGIHVERNLLLCSSSFGGYQATDEVVDNSTQRTGWHPDGQGSMHGCPGGMAVTGVHASRNLLSCASLDRLPTSYFVDKETQIMGMHACPPGTVVAGIHVANNWLLCRTLGEDLIGAEGHQRNEMISCPRGWYMTGVHIRANTLLCSNEFGPWEAEIVEANNALMENTIWHRACPQGMAATGLHNGKSLIACATISGERNPYPGPSVQRANMMACPQGSVLVGYRPEGSGFSLFLKGLRERGVYGLVYKEDQRSSIMCGVRQ